MPEFLMELIEQLETVTQEQTGEMEEALPPLEPGDVVIGTVPDELRGLTILSGLADERIETLKRERSLIDKNDSTRRGERKKLTRRIQFEALWVELLDKCFSCALCRHFVDHLVDPSVALTIKKNWSVVLEKCRSEEEEIPTFIVPIKDGRSPMHN